MTTPAWLDVVDEARRESAAGRPDLAAVLHRLRGRLVQPDFRVLVIGAAKQGKSQLINAMLNAPVCPVSDQVSTALSTVLRYEDSPQAELLRSLGVLGDDASAIERVPVPVDNLASELTTMARDNKDGDLLRAEVGLPRALLATGLVLVDGPGFDHMTPARFTELLTDADAVLVASDAGRPLTPIEFDLVRAAAKLCARIACVRTKTDLAADWQRTVEDDRLAMARVMRGVDMFGVSSTLRMHAVQTNDEAVNEESGFPALINYLQQDLAGHADKAARYSVARAVIEVADQITLVGRAELLIQPPQDESESMQVLVAAQRRADELRKQSTRWQHALSDGMADIISDIDFDLRERTRRILREADRAFNRADPLKVWDEFSAWLVENLSAAVIENFGWAAERTRWLNRQVARNFTEIDRHQLPQLELAVPMAVEERLADLEKPDIEPVKIGHKIVTGLRGSYSGLLMFGMATSLTGLPLVNVVSVSAGALLGTKTLREDRDAQLKRRQALAKTAVQRHVDEVVFYASKYSRDALRHVQRTLRTHFSEVVEELQDSIAESINQATLQARNEAVERDRRSREIAGQLERLAMLRRRAELLVGQASIAA